MQNGFPTTTIIPFSEITLEPEKVQTSTDGSVATSFTFKSPIYVEGGKDYCVCLASNSTKYSVYISRVGENDILTQSYISQQPTLGSLFKSQNGSTWTASDLEDLKFTLYRADFVTSPASFRFYNPDLSIGNNQIVSLRKNPLNVYSNSALIGLGNSLSVANQNFLHR